MPAASSNLNKRDMKDFIINRPYYLHFLVALFSLCICKAQVNQDRRGVFIKQVKIVLTILHSIK